MKPTSSPSSTSNSWQQAVQAITAERQYTFSDYSHGETADDLVYHTYIPELHRALRIVQADSDDDAAAFSAWTNTIPMERAITPADELVIRVRDAQQTGGPVKALIRAWLIEDMAPSELDNRIQQLGQR